MACAELYSLYSRCIPLLSMLYLGCGNSWHCSIYPFFVLSSVDTNNTNIVARSERFIFIFYLYLYWNFIYVRWTGSSHSLDTLVFTVWFTQLIHVCCSPFQYGCLDVPLSWPASCSRACQKIVLATPRLEDFGFLIHFAHFRNAFPSPRYSFIASYDGKNELKNKPYFPSFIFANYANFS